MAKSDIISRLRLDSGEFDSKIKRAGQELLAYSEHCKKVSLQMGFANKDAVDFAKALGSMQTTSQTARGKINELSEALVNAKVMFKNMTDAEKNSEFGRNLATSLDQLKARLQSAKKDLADVQQELSGSKFGQFGSILDGIGQKMGLNANITELLTSKTALMSAGIGAAGAIVGKATQEWAKYNAELAKQDQITTVTTGLKGADSDRMTDQARALTDTYGVDFREAINAANTLMTQFGQTGEQAMSLIRDGMQGMIQGDGPKLLSMIQQYAPAFRDAGVTASQLVAVIQNSEGGIFTDQNMNAIVMGIKNIRLMTKATSDALAQLGIDGQKMSQQLRDGSMTIFDALKQVATQIQGVNSNSQAAGEVMQQVFGRQGAMAGTKLGEAIATLNTNLEETKRQTGEVGDAYNDLYNANVKLNGAIRDCFEYDGWDQMATGIKSSLVSALASVIEKLATIKQFLTGMSANDYLKQMGGSDKVSRMIGRLGNGQGNARNIYDRQVGAFEAYINPRKKYLENLDAWRRGNRSEGVKDEVDWGRDKFGIDDRAIRNSVKAAESQLEEYQKKAEQVFSNVNKKSGEINIDMTGGNKGGNKGGRTTTRTKTEPTYAADSIAAQAKLVADLTKQWNEAGADVRDKYVAPIIEAERKLKDMKNQLSLAREQSQGRLLGGTVQTQNLGSVISTNTTSVSETTSIIDKLREKVQKEITAENLKIDQNIFKEVFQTSVQNGIDGMDIQFSALSEKIAKGIDIPDKAWESLVEQINKKLKDMGIDPIEINFKTGKLSNPNSDSDSDNDGNGNSNRRKKKEKYEPESVSQVISDLSGNVGGILTGLNQLGVDIPEGLQGIIGGIQGMMTILTSINTILSIIEALQAVKSLPFFSQGGIIGRAAAGMLIPGNSNSGDNLRLPMMDGSGFIGVNSGELILNKSQQNNLANALDGGGLQGMNLSAQVSGEQILLVANRTLRRKGKGELVTWK